LFQNIPVYFTFCVLRDGLRHAVMLLVDPLSTMPCSYPSPTPARSVLWPFPFPDLCILLQFHWLTIRKLSTPDLPNVKTLWRPLLSYGYSYKASCATRG